MKPSLLKDNYKERSIIYKKIEKISAAIYLITSLFPDSEPMKWKLRDIAIRVVSHDLLSLDVPDKDFAMTFKRFHEKSRELLTVLEVGFYAGTISPMNYTIITTEIAKLLQYIEKNELAGEGTLAEEFFTPTSAELSVTSTTVSSKKEVFQSLGHNESVVAPVRENKVDRQEIIIEMLKKRPKLGIKDFIGSIKNCSEKTIQRELLTLVKNGVIHKEGERRWSTYSLL